jgi:glycosyltransferase involved in cell wall biosynthesis
MIEAFAAIRGDQDRLLMIGDGPERDNLQRLADQLNVSRQLEWLGYISPEHIVPCYGTLHTLVLPSLVEPWGLVVNEALASGRQVVVSNRCGSVANMTGWRGVFETEPTAEGLAIAMAESRAVWKRPILDSEIFEHGIDESAGLFLKGILTAVGGT